MRFTNTSNRLGLVALAIIASPFASAQDPNWYLGGNIGHTEAKVDNARIANDFLGGDFAITSINDKERNRDTGFKLFGGYRFNRYFSLEGGYFDLGRLGFTATTAPPGTLSSSLFARGLNFDAIASLPMGERFSLFARAGVTHVNADESFSSTGLVPIAYPHSNKRDTNYKFGGGLQCDFTDHVGMRAEWERYRINGPARTKGDIDMISLGLVFRFGGGQTPTYYPRAETPVPVAPPPEPVIAPAPVMVYVPAPVTQQYCTILDIQFEIDKDEIQREEKERLAVVGTFMTKYPNTTAVIEGHTDNVGSVEHNTQLSQRRAESVVSYLVDTFHVSPTRLKAVGYGDLRPVADNDTEDGKRKNRRINAVVACATDVEGLTVAPARITMAMFIEFDQNKAEVKPQYRGELKKVADFLKANPRTTATVEGHTGNLQATPALAMEISQLRAQHVVNYLVENFYIDRSRLSAEGFGRNRRFAYNTTAEGQQENRRVNIIINYHN